MFTLLFVFSSIIAFLMACAIGAQDVSHSFATSVGSKALTGKQVIYLGSICEFSGSLFGGSVAGLFSSGIIDTTVLTTPDQLDQYFLVVNISLVMLLLCFALLLEHLVGYV